MSLPTVSVFDRISRPIEILSKIAAITIPFLLFFLGNQINKQRTIESDNQQKLNRVLTLIKSLSSDNNKEKLLAINFAQYLANTNQYPPEMYGALASIVTTDTTISVQAQAVLNTLKVNAVKNNNPQEALQLSQAIQVIKPRVYIQFQKNGISRDSAEKVQQQLQTKGYNVPKVEAVNQSSARIELRYYRKGDTDKVNALRNDLEQNGISAAPVYIQGYEQNTTVKPNTFELWLH